MRYDPIMCMMVDDSVKTHDELSLAQKKQVVTELKGFLKKSYNFSDESEYARAYEDLRYMFTTGSRKSISGLFENAVKKTGAHDSVKTKDRDPYAYEEIKKDIQMMKSGKASYITKNELIGRISHSFNNRTPQSGGITKEQKTELMNLVMSSKDERTIDKAIRSCDRDPYEYETIKNDIDIAARGKASYITKSSLQSRITRGFQTNRLTKEQEEELWNLAKSVKQ